MWKQTVLLAMMSVLMICGMDCKENTAHAGPVVKYHPPVRGMPAYRIGGGNRNLTTLGNITLSVLTPKEVGYTSTSQPTLYWFISKPVRVQVEISLLGEQEIDPFVKQTVSLDHAGVQRFSLAEQGLQLQAGKDYQWTVALVSDEKQRSGDLLSTGGVRWVPLPTELQQQLANTSGEQLAQQYMEFGYWYDAWEILEKTGSAKELQRELLNQVELPEVAELIQ